MTTRVKESETTREEEVNVHLALLLSQHGVKAKAERRSKRGTPDIRITLRSGLILLECKWEGSEKPLKDQLQERRADFPEALAMFGVLYPERLRHTENTRSELEEASDLQWWLDYARGSSPPGLGVRRSGSVANLADHLRILPLDLDVVDRVEAAAESVGYALEQAVKPLAQHKRIARRIADIIASTDQEKNRAAALRIGCLVLFNALTFQDRLAAVNADVPTVQESLRGGIPGLRENWRSICKNIDYEPVFELAADIAEVLEDGPEEFRTSAVEPLVKAMEETRHVEGHDLSGRLFHTLLSDAKFTGTYYTSVPAATLLARLVFHNWPEGVDWSDHTIPASLDVADLACGTGTLLMAVAAEVGRLHSEAGGNDAAALHKAMVEQALRGYDVQLSAIHFAATSLAMLNPDIEFDRMNLFVMPLGTESERVSLGSLDYLGTNKAWVQRALSPKETGVNTSDIEQITGSGSRGVAEGAEVEIPQLDLAIMNPPFTRSDVGNLLFGSLPTAERRKLQDELARRLKSRQASATAGLGAAFVAAVAPKLRHGEGRLALVLPLTVCTGSSWAQTRALIEQDFVLDMVIVSHDPQRWNFSDSTDLSEALLIATRRPRLPARSRSRTTFVNLWHSPDGVLEAHRVAQAITATSPAKLEATGTALLEVDGRHVGEVVSLPETTIARKQWFGVQFARADVARVAARLFERGEIWVPGGASTKSIALRRLGDLGQIGPDVRRLDDGFERTSSKTAYPLVDRHDTERRKSFLCSPDAYLSPLAKPKGGQRPGYGEKLWQQSSGLLLGARFWLNTTRVVAMRSETSVLARMWWPIRVEDISFEKALTAWFNGSLGILTLLMVRNTTRGCWVQLKKADLADLPVLDLREISVSQLQELSQLFDSLATAEFERLPRMAHCPARRALDDGIAKILDLPDLSTLRDLLASEPVISNRRL